MTRTFQLVLLGCLMLGCSAGEREQQISDQSGLATETPKQSATTHQVASPVVVNASPLEVNESLSDFVGSESCRDCHVDNYATFQKNDHSRSLRKPDADEEKLTRDFWHEPSQQRFAVETRGETVRHLAWQKFSNPDVALPIADFEIEYVVGSGAFAKSYLLERDGARFQSPIAFYTKPQQYEMSPGYDTQTHRGFTRQVSDQCLFCHAGILKRAGSNPLDFEIQETAIGCERCHGAGSQHIAQASSSEVSHESRTEVPSTTDWAIVHPGKEDREIRESICASCHLQGNITMHPESADNWTYRPGQRLSDSKIEYSVSQHSLRNNQNDQESELEFVGHFAQMHASKCYLGSDTLTCVSCHSPHHEEIQNETAYHRQNCLQCHSDDECGKPHEDRIAENDNSCHQCHMPRRKTDVPHTAITNHRIATYPHNSEELLKATPGQAPDPSSNSIRVTQLPNPIALLDGAPLNSQARKRNELAAVAMWAVNEAGIANVSRPIVRDLISRLRIAVKEQATDGVCVSESRIRMLLADLLKSDASWRQPGHFENEDGVPQTENEHHEYIEHVMWVLRHEPKGTLLYQLAVDLLASDKFANKDYRSAIVYFEQLADYCRSANVHYNLGLLYARQRRFGEAEAALRLSISMDRTYQAPYRSLSRLYRTIDADEAKRCAQIADLLSQ